MTEIMQAADTASMRAEADQLKASVREDNRSLYERHRRAMQLEYEAALIDERDMAAAELEGCRSRTPRLQAALDEAVTAEAAAEGKRRADERHLARRPAEQAKARTDNSPVERQEEAAIRVHVSEDVARASQAAAAGVRVAREKAEAELEGAWEVHVAELDREYAAAERKASDPGTAPNMPPLAPGVATLDDMEPEARQMLGLYVALLTGLSSGSDRAASQPQQPDPGQFRYVQQGGLLLAIPSARRP